MLILLCLLIRSVYVRVSQCVWTCREQSNRTPSCVFLPRCWKLWMVQRQLFVATCIQILANTRTNVYLSQFDLSSCPVAELKDRKRERLRSVGVTESRSIYHRQIPHVDCVRCREERNGNTTLTAADGSPAYTSQDVKRRLPQRTYRCVFCSGPGTGNVSADCSDHSFTAGLWGQMEKYAAVMKPSSGKHRPVEKLSVPPRTHAEQPHFTDLSFLQLCNHFKARLKQLLYPLVPL